jgi:hypothetical protein
MQSLAHKYKQSAINSRNPLLLVVVLAFCLCFSIPDGATYFYYAAHNGSVLSNVVGGGAVGLVVKAWCAWGASIGVSIFALNNMWRWSQLINESCTMFAAYGNSRAIWIVFVLTTLLGLLSVVPFYGMAEHAGLPMGLVIGNSLARLCMDHYAWQRVVMGLVSRVRSGGVANLLGRVSKRRALGVVIFICGAITATYLFPFARSVSNLYWAVLGVAPTCLLWGLDSRSSWNSVYLSLRAALHGRRSADYELFDNDIRFIKHIVTALLVLMCLAGAVSETMMASHNAHSIGYPEWFLLPIAAIAFTGIYSTGPWQIVFQIAAFWQKKRNHSVATKKLIQRENIVLDKHIAMMTAK